MPMEMLYSQPYLESLTQPPRGFPQSIDIVIGGRSYVANTSFEPYRRDAFRHRSIQAQRESISLDNLPGEGTVNTEGLWRREAWDWHFGAGQPYQDRKDSVDARFSISKGVDPWMQWQLSLLDDTYQVYPLGAGGGVLQCGPCVYVLDLLNHAAFYTTDLATWKEVGGMPADIASMATDGASVYFASPSLGLFVTSANTATAALCYTPPMDSVFYAGERLLSCLGNSIYNITSIPTFPAQEVGLLTTGLTAGSPVTSLFFAGGTTLAVSTGDHLTMFDNTSSFTQTFVSTGDYAIGATDVGVATQNANFSYEVGVIVVDINPLWTHPNPSFAFSAVASGSSQIYLGGYVDAGAQPLQSVVYRTTVEATGTALTIPVQALPMEGGEYCTSLYGYLNYIFVGSNLGIRMCRTIAAYDPTGNEGDLEAGPLIPGLFPPGPVNSPVYAFTANNRFVYFGWNNYDGESTGLGRCDLSTFIDTQAPAFASDLMVTGSGTIGSMDWCTINDAPIFCVDGKGVFTDVGYPVNSGYVQSGQIGYGISDDKILWAGGIGTISPQQGTVAMSVSVDGAVQTLVGTQNSSANGGTAIQSPFAIHQIRGDLTTVQMTLSKDTVTGQSPILHRFTLKALPAITAGTTISAVLLLYKTMNQRGADQYFDQYAEYQYLYNLRTTQTLVMYQEASFSAPCVIDELDWLPFKQNDADVEGGFIGDLIVYLKTVDIGA